MSSLNEDKSALQEFFKEFDGNNFESAMSNHLTKASSSARDFAQKVVAANSQVALSEQETTAKIKEYSAQQSVSIENKVSKISSIGSKLKGFGANLLTGLASGAAWAAVGLAIEGVYKGVDYLANKDKYAAEDAQKLTDSYKQQEDTFRSHTSTLQGMQSEYNELSKHVDSSGKNIDLSAEEYKRYHEIVNQIVQIEPSLASGYDSEGNAILSRNDALQQAINLQQQELKLKQQAQTEGKDSETTWNGNWADYRNNAYLSANSTHNNAPQGTSLYFDWKQTLNNGSPILGTVSDDKLSGALKGTGIAVDQIKNKEELTLNVEEQLLAKRQQITNQAVVQAQKDGASADQVQKIKTELDGTFESLQKAKTSQTESLQKQLNFIDTWVSSSDSVKWYKDLSANGMTDDFNNTFTKYLKSHPNLTETDAKSQAQEIGKVYGSIKDKLPIKEFNDLSDAIKKGNVTESQEKSANSAVQSLRKLASQYKTTGNTIASDFVSSLTDGYAQEVKSADELIESNKNVSDSFTSMADAEQQAVSGLETAQEKYDAYTSGIESLIKLQQSSGTGTSLDPTSYKKAADALPGVDLSKAVEYHNGDMQFNTDKLNQMVKAYADVQEAANNASISTESITYQENAQQIAAYTNQLKTNTFAEGENKDSIQSKIDDLNQEQTSIQNSIQSYEMLNNALQESTSNYTKWQNAQKTREEGDMFTDVSSAKGQIDDALKTGKVGTKKYQAAVEFLIPDTFEPKDQKRVQDYLSKLNRYITKDSKGQLTAEGMTNFMSDAVSKGFFSQSSDGQYKLIGKHSMQEIAKGMNITDDMAKAIFGNLEDYGMKFDFADEWATKTTASAKEVNDSISKVYKSIASISNDKTLTVDVKTQKLTEAYADLYKLQKIKDHLGSETTNVKIQAELQIDNQIDTAQKKVDNLKKTVANSSGVARITATTNLSNAQRDLDKLQETKNGLAKPTVAEINLQINQNNNELTNLKTNLDTLKKNPKDAKVVQNLMVQYNIKDSSESDAKQVEEYINSKMSSIKKDTKSLQEDLKINYAADTSAVDSANAKVNVEYGATKSALETNPIKISADNSSALSAISSVGSALETLNGKTVTANVVVNSTVNGSSGSNDGKKKEQYPKVLGGAGANGTAYADGNWGATVGGKTLVGELGQEIVVDPANGKWHTVGENGAEFVDIPRGAIVFNHIQSKDILENGYVTSRGSIVNALANGTAHVQGNSLASGNALVTGGGYLPSSNPAVSGYYEGDAGDTSAKKKNTKATKDNTEAKKENTKSKKDSADATKEENKALDDYEKKLEHEKNMGQYDSVQGKIQYVQKLQYAYKNLAKTQEEKWKLEEEIYAGQGEILSAAKDEISNNDSLGKYVGNATQKYKDLLVVKEKYAKTTQQQIDMDKELYSVEKDIISEQQTSIEHLVSMGQIVENTWDYVRKIDGLIKTINGSNLSAGEKKSEIDALNEKKYSSAKAIAQESFDKTYSEMENRVALGQVKENSKSYRQNLEEAYKLLTTGQTMQPINTEENRLKVLKDIHEAEKSIVDESETNLQHEVAIGNVRENSLEYLQQMKLLIQQINQDENLGVEDKKERLDKLNEQYYSSAKSYVSNLENAMADETLTGSYGYRMKQIQDQIDAINQTNDSLSKQIALEKAKAAWEEAQNQKTVSVYKAGYGFVYEADQKNVTEKKEAYEDASREKQIQDLTDQKNAIQKEMDAQKKALENSLKNLSGYSKDSMSSWDSVSKQIQNCITDINSALGTQTTVAKTQYTTQISDLRQQTSDKDSEYTKQITNLNDFNKSYDKASKNTIAVDNKMVDSTTKLANAIDRTATSFTNLGESYLKSESDRQSANDSYNSYNESQAEARANGNQYASVPYYASGTDNSLGGLAITDENGLELKLSPLSSGKYTMLSEGSKVFTAEATKNLSELSKINPNMLLSKIALGGTQPNLNFIQRGFNSQPASNSITIDHLDFPNVTDSQEIKDAITDLPTYFTQKKYSK